MFIIEGCHDKTKKVFAQTQAGFMFTAIKEWNALPPNVKSAKTLFSFKKQIKNYYLSQY